MKDALGHGSNAHAAGVEQVGKAPLSPGALTSGKTYAGKFNISARDPESMPQGALEKEYEQMTLHSSALNREFIDQGRGQERPTEIRSKTDDLSRRYNAVSDRVQKLSNEHQSRYRMGGRRVVDPSTGSTKYVGKSVSQYMKSGYYQK
jgi:hypothetical protein